MRVCTYFCLYIHVYIYIYMFMYMCILTYARTHQQRTYKYSSHSRSHTHNHWTHTLFSSLALFFKCTHIHTQSFSPLQARTHTHTHTHTHTQVGGKPTFRAHLLHYVDSYWGFHFCKVCMYGEWSTRLIWWKLNIRDSMNMQSDFIHMQMQWNMRQPYAEDMTSYIFAEKM